MRLHDIDAASFIFGGMLSALGAQIRLSLLHIFVQPLQTTFALTWKCTSRRMSEMGVYLLLHQAVGYFKPKHFKRREFTALSRDRILWRHFQ